MLPLSGSLSRGWLSSSVPGEGLRSAEVVATAAATAEEEAEARGASGRVRARQGGASGPRRHGIAASATSVEVCGSGSSSGGGGGGGGDGNGGCGAALAQQCRIKADRSTHGCASPRESRFHWPWRSIQEPPSGSEKVATLGSAEASCCGPWEWIHMDGYRLVTATLLSVQSGDRQTQTSTGASLGSSGCRLDCQSWLG